MSDTSLRAAINALIARYADSNGLVGMHYVADELRRILHENPPFNPFPTEEEIRQLQTGRE